MKIIHRSEADSQEVAQLPDPRTLCVDVGGTGIKAMVVDGAGTPLTERARVETPRPATPDSVIEAILQLVASLADTSRPAGMPLGHVLFDRVSVGFPGVVVRNTTMTAPNLDSGWAGFGLGECISAHLGKPRVGYLVVAAHSTRGTLHGRLHSGR